MSTRTFDLPGIGPRTYTFPSRFEHVELLNAQVLLPTDDVARWLPPGLTPVSMAGQTRGMVTMQHLGAPPDGMAPYTEASFAVRVRAPDGSKGWHTLTMPVDSEENRQRGLVIFGYPKEMAALQMSDSAHGRRGTVRTPAGEPMLSLDVGQRFPLAWSRDIDNRALQRHEGRLVALEAKGEGRARLGGAHVTFGAEMRRRFPGLPEHPRVLVGGSMTDATLSLSLPKDA